MMLQPSRASVVLTFYLRVSQTNPTDTPSFRKLRAMQFTSILPQSRDLHNGQVKYYLDTNALGLSINLPDINIYITTMFYFIVDLFFSFFCKKTKTNTHTHNEENEKYNKNNTKTPHHTQQTTTKNQQTKQNKQTETSKQIIELRACTFRKEITTFYVTEL